MAMPIFWRLMCGYAGILLLSLATISYSVFQLTKLSTLAHTALNTENRMIGYQEKLTDAFLSEVRYSGKFIITRAKPLHDQLQQFKGDFLRYIDELKASAESADIQTRLARVEAFHLRYHELFNQEVQYLNARQPYAETRYREEKEKMLENALGELVALKAHLQKQLQEKLELVESAAGTSRTIALTATIALLAFGIGLSLAISRSIVNPLAQLRRAADYAGNESPESSDFSRLPEIHDLAIALGNAQRRLQDAARANATFVHLIYHEFSTPLMSINKRLNFLRTELTPHITGEQIKQIEILAAETERLVERCCQLPQPPKEAVNLAELKAAKPLRRLIPKRTADAAARDHSQRLVRCMKEKIEPIWVRARELWSGSWTALRESLASGLWKGEKR
jgi:CHASE3 domain sensor protein